jgi:hypothetical protein
MECENFSIPTRKRLLQWVNTLLYIRAELTSGPGSGYAVLLTSLVTAEVVYKLHSFTLECLAFLATWLVVNGVLTLMARMFARPTEPIAR